MCAATNPVCSSLYDFMEDSWRALNSSAVTSNCDYALPSSRWYRVKLNGKNAMLQTSPLYPGNSVCGTTNPTWFDGECALEFASYILSAVII